MKPCKHYPSYFITLFIFCSLSLPNLCAQSWNINGNANIAAATNFLGTTDINDMVIRTNAIERGRILGTGGSWRFGTATNFASIDSTGKLSFKGKGAYQVDGNKYAFQYSGDPDYGLYFNSSNVQYEFRNGTAAPVFWVNANTGAGTFLNTLKVGAYTLPATDGLANQVLKTNGAGVLQWSNDSSGSNLTAGSGIGIASNIVTNTSPDQLVTLTPGIGIGVTGTYPNFTLTNNAPDQLVALTPGTGMTVTGTYPNFTLTNSAPDRTVALAAASGVSVTGTYPNFTLSGSGLWNRLGNSATSPLTDFLGTIDSVDLVFRTKNTERIRLKADGKMAIGTVASPAARLHVNAPTGESPLRIQTNGITRLFVDQAGGVTIGSTTLPPSGGLYVAGNVGIGGSAAAAPTAKLQVSDATPVNNTAGGYMVINNSGSNSMLALDNDEIQSRFENGSPAIMYLNRNGGDVSLGDTLSDVRINGNTYCGSAERFKDAGGNLLSLSAGLMPELDNSYRLGESANRWKSIYAVDGTINTSDLRDKKNIRDLDYGLKDLMKLHSVRFNWKNGETKEDKLGLIAQELKKVIPEVVRDYEYKVVEEKTGEKQKVPAEHWGVMYSDLIPVLIRAIQQQEEHITEQDKKIEELTMLIKQAVQRNTVESDQSAQLFVSLSDAVLEQNIPNPFNNTTSIRYNIPQKFGAAKILINDKNGKTIKSVNIPQSGKGTLTVDASLISAGAYSYSLIVDGKMTDSKQMIITR